MRVNNEITELTEEEKQAEIDRRRLIIVHIDESAVLAIFQQRTKSLAVPVFPQLPKGYEIRGVHYDFEYQSFAFKIWHMEFAPVDTFSVIPSVPTPMAMMQDIYTKVSP